MTFKPGDVVYYDDHRMTVSEGPFRTLDYPGVDQYLVKTVHGTVKPAWASDLMSEADYIEATAEEGCRE